MSKLIEINIVKCEEQLRQAILESDVSALSELLAPDLIFTNHLGQIMTKQDDLDAHQSGTLKVDVLNITDQSIRVIGDVAIVNVKARLEGCYAGTSSAADFRFTRIWAPSSGGDWQVVAGHSCVVV